MTASRARSRIGAVLLAAGTGARMGGRPKALLELDGVPLVLGQLKALLGAGVDRQVVVLGAHAERIRPLIEHLPITVLQNPRPGDGQISSQRLGLAALREVDAVMVALADQPLITERDIASLMAVFRQRSAETSVIVPRVAGHPGNPVIFSAAVREQILEGASTLGCREWRVRNPGAVLHFDTDNRSFIVDVDAPEDIERFERETGRTLRWPRGDRAE
jgi:molybdenum cofactor cytidylyltransferase